MEDRKTSDSHPDQADEHGDFVKQKPTIIHNRIGRNDPCPCGSGKKFKSCCISEVDTTVSLPAQTPDLAKQSRLVVKFNKGSDGSHQFQWGVVGHIPIMSLVGYITKVQFDIRTSKVKRCIESALVIAYDGDQAHPENHGKLSWFVHEDVPVDSVVGMLEMIKTILVSSQLANMAQQQMTGLVDPTGAPMAKKGILHLGK